MKRIILIISSLLLAAAAYAQKGNIGYVYPAGAQRGTSVEIEVGGQGLAKAKGILISGEGISAEPVQQVGNTKGRKKRRKGKDIGEEDNLQLADRVRFRLTIDSDAKLGMRDLRLVMPNGVTNRLYFEVGELPDVAENSKEKLSAVSETLPVTFNGQIMRSDVDRLRFKATAGQQLVIQVKGRVFVPYMADAVPGWFQPVMRLYGPDGKEVAFNDDYTFHVDPVILYKVEKSGYYDIEINDGLYRGREDFVYRIDVGELPFITSISPIGGPVGKKCKVELRGWNLKSKTITVQPGKEGRIPVTATGKTGLTSNTLFYHADDFTPHRESRRSKPNLSEKTAWNMELGEVCEQNVGGELQQHWYSFSLPEKKRVTLEVFARRLGAPTDMRMTIFNESGEKVADVDDFEDPEDYMATHFADPQYTGMLQGGNYLVRLVEAQGKYGEDYSYRFRLDVARPDFSLNIEPSTFSVPAGGTGVFNVFITRKQKFGGAVHLSVEGLPEGFTVSGNNISQGRKKTIVSVSAPETAEIGTVHPKVIGSPQNKKLDIRREAVPSESMMQAFYYTHLMPIEDFRMEVSPQLPFRLSIDKTWDKALKLKRGGTVPVKVRIERKPDFNQPVTLMLKSNDGAIKADSVILEPDMDEATLNVFIKGNKKNKKDTRLCFYVQGVVKGSSKKVAGKGRTAFSASILANTPVYDIILPAYRGK